MMEPTPMDLVVSRNERCPPCNTSERLIKPLLKFTKKLTKLKCQDELLTGHGGLDIFSSIRPKIGKQFSNPVYNKQLTDILEESRLKIIQLSIIEKAEEICNTRIELDRIYAEMQSLPFDEFKALKRRAQRAES